MEIRSKLDGKTYHLYYIASAAYGLVQVKFSFKQVIKIVGVVFCCCKNSDDVCIN